MRHNHQHPIHSPVHCGCVERKTESLKRLFLCPEFGVTNMYADPVDEAAARQQQMIDNALANRKRPEPPSSVCRNGDCGEKSQSGTSYCSPECREDVERLARAERQRRIG